MAQRSGVAGFVQQSRANGELPQVAFFVNESAAIYYIATGNKADADAWVQDLGSGVFCLNDAVAEEDRVPYLVNTNTVI